MKTHSIVATALLTFVTHTTSTSFTFPLTIKPYDNMVIYFGNNRDGFFYPPPVEALRKHAFSILTSIQKRLGLERFALLRAQYGSDGRAITDVADMPPAYSCPGDYLLSNQPGLGLMMSTADALPIVLIDPIHHAIGVAYASWQSTAANIATKVVEAMQGTFGSNPQELQIIFGPGIRSCCYNVPEERRVTLNAEFGTPCARKNESGEIFVDLPRINERQFIACGVLPENIATRFCRCTKCDPQFFSYRREGSRAGRQLSVIALTK